MPKVWDFWKQLGTEGPAIKKIMAVLKKLECPLFVICADDKFKQWRDYGDVAFFLPKGPRNSETIRGVECKQDSHRTTRVFLEVWSQKEKEKRGWMYTGRGQFLFYNFAVSCPGREKSYLFNFSKLRTWFQANEQQLAKNSIHHGYRKIPNKGWTTIGIAVEIADIPKHLILNTKDLLN